MIENTANSQDLEIGASRKPDIQGEYQQQKSSFPLSRKRQNKLLEVNSQQKLDQNEENLNSNANANCVKQHSEGIIFGTPNGSSDLSHFKGNCDSGELQSLELTLKRPRGAGDAGNAALEDCNVLRHSDQSAFSK